MSACNFRSNVNKTPTQKKGKKAVDLDVAAKRKANRDIAAAKAKVKKAAKVT